MTIDKQEMTTSWDELPATITTYLTAHQERDVATAVAAFADDAVVTDEGNTYRGRDGIRDWLQNAASGFTFTTEFVGATRLDAVHVDVVQHLEGDFPGGVADLYFRFTMDGALISRLVIEP
ncbi:nuclear transport factor 2 family protein [Mycobacterium neglectum]|uniref:nuclear transport factor 2 family protein n=1 Tax=Mycobacterium neglectum TaxID=242737 RepID=UPI000BFEB2BB|nr:nuclear transport factor 2 family protein [Mycobacterium neglectum]